MIRRGGFCRRSTSIWDNKNWNDRNDKINYNRYYDYCKHHHDNKDGNNN